MSSDWSQLRIFFPGPTWVAPEVRAAMAAQVLHHRTAEYRSLHESVATRMQQVLFTQRPVYLVTASGTGLMEAAVRNLIRGRSLALANGSFGERLHKMAIANGKEADLLAFDWGKGVRPERVREALATGRYDTVTLVHNETSTGVMNPLRDIAAVVREFPEVLLVVDAVSSLGGVRIEVDALGIDFIFAGVQKCLALPPGLSVAVASEKAMARARTVTGRGTYFDLVALDEAAANNETPFTPSVPHVAALAVQLDRIAKEGLEARFQRHAAMAEQVRGWARSHLDLFAEEGFRSETVTAIRNTRGLDMGKLLAALKRRGFVCASGYGKLKGETFRIGHMGDLTTNDVTDLLAALDDSMAEIGGAA